MCDVVFVCVYLIFVHHTLSLILQTNSFHTVSVTNKNPFFFCEFVRNFYARKVSVVKAMNVQIFIYTHTHAIINTHSDRFFLLFINRLTHAYTWIERHMNKFWNEFALQIFSFKCFSCCMCESVWICFFLFCFARFAFFIMNLLVIFNFSSCSFSRFFLFHFRSLMLILLLLPLFSMLVRLFSFITMISLGSFYCALDFFSTFDSIFSSYRSSDSIDFIGCANFFFRLVFDVFVCWWCFIVVIIIICCGCCFRFYDAFLMACRSLFLLALLKLSCLDRWKIYIHHTPLLTSNYIT